MTRSQPGFTAFDWAPHPDPYDFVVGSCGYERRSSYLLTCSDQIDARRAWAPQFVPAPNSSSFELNLRDFAAADIDVAPPAAGESEIGREFLRRMQPLLDEQRPLRVGLDCSSMSRSRLAQLTKAASLVLPPSSELHLLYALAGHSDDVGESERLGGIEALDGFSDSADSTAPPVLFIGIGFEVELALKVIDALSPRELFVFAPHGYDRSYDDDLERRIGSRPIVGWRNFVRYDPSRPFDILRLLLPRVRGSLRLGSPVGVALGPKSFAMALLTSAILSNGDLSVLRAVHPPDGREVDRFADGTVCGLVLRFIES